MFRSGSGCRPPFSYHITTVQKYVNTLMTGTAGEENHCSEPFGGLVYTVPDINQVAGTYSIMEERDEQGFR